RLKPREGPDQRTIGFRLETAPAAAVVEYQDAFGNIVHALSVHEPHRKLVVTAESLIERIPAREPEGLKHRFSDFLAGDDVRSQEEYDFLNPSRYVPFSNQLRKLFWMAHPGMDEPVAIYTRRIMAWIRDQFAYEPGTTN